MHQPAWHCYMRRTFCWLVLVHSLPSFLTFMGVGKVFFIDCLHLFIIYVWFMWPFFASIYWIHTCVHINTELVYTECKKIYGYLQQGWCWEKDIMFPGNKLYVSWKTILASIGSFSLPSGPVVLAPVVFWLKLDSSPTLGADILNYS